MNRWLMAAVMVLTVAGCAEAVDDPVPSPGPDPVQKAPPAQPFSGELQQGADDPKLAGNTGAPDVPELPNQLEPPPMPGQE